MAHGIFGTNKFGEFVFGSGPISASLTIQVDAVTTVTINVVAARNAVTTIDAISELLSNLSAAGAFGLEIDISTITEILSSISAIRGVTTTIDILTTDTFGIGATRTIIVTTDAVTTTTYGLTTARALSLIIDALTTVSNELTATGLGGLDVVIDAVSTTLSQLNKCSTLGIEIPVISTVIDQLKVDYNIDITINSITSDTFDLTILGVTHYPLRIIISQTTRNNPSVSAIGGAFDVDVFDWFRFDGAMVSARGAVGAQSRKVELSIDN